MAIPHFRYSFAQGFHKLTQEDAKTVKAEIVQYLGCQYESTYSRQKNAYRDMPKHVYDKINQIFARHGIPEDSIWTIKREK